MGYGEVMWRVQMWELGLALVWWRYKRKHKSRPSGDVDSARTQEELRRLEVAFLKASAQSVREAVEPQLEPAAAESLQELMHQRNRLVHRFLRDQRESGGGFRPGTGRQLMELEDAFDESAKALMRTLTSLGEHDGPVLPHWPAAAEGITDRLFRGESLRDEDSG